MNKRQAVISKIVESIFSKKYSKGVEELIEKFFNDGAMPKEKDVALLEQWDKMSVDPSWIRSKIRYRRIRKCIKKNEAQEPRRGNFGRVVVVASVAVLMVGVGGWIFMQRDMGANPEFIAGDVEQFEQGVVESGEVFEIGVPVKKLEERAKLVAVARRTQPVVKHVEMPKESEEISVVNPSLSVQEVVLDDGSKVTLYANSQIKYARKFLEKEERRVELIGGASFEVARNEAVELFVVATEKLSVNVLGTVFDLEAYGWSDEVLVALHSGSVGVRVGEAEEIKLKPNEKLLYNISDGSVDVGVIADDQEPELVEIDWKQGPLVFDAMTINEIAEALAVRFDVETEIEQDVRNDNRIYSVSFDQDVELGNVLRVLGLTVRWVEMKVVENKLSVYIK